MGDAYDNALRESIIGLYKTECIDTDVFRTGPWRAITEVEFATADWVAWYNTSRLHTSLDMVPPAEYEAAHFAALNPEEQPV